MRSIITQTRKCSYEITVFDNNSTDGSADAVEAEFHCVRVFRSRENLGFARATNLAAREAKGRHLLLLNPDTLILDGAVETLNDFADQFPHSEIWGGRTLFEDGSLDYNCCCRYLNLWSLFCFVFGLAHAFPKNAILNSELYGGWERDSVRPVDVVSGSFLLINRSLWEALKGFDPIFFMYGEEVDLCRRAITLGAKPMFSPHATIIHYGGRSETSIVDRRIKLLKGHVTFVRRHWRGAKLSWGLTLFRAFPILRSVLYRVASFVRPEHHANAEMWRRVWEARTAWTGGYPAPDNDYYNELAPDRPAA